MKNIYVTKPYLPELEEFNSYLKDIWSSAVLTNNGRYAKELEKLLLKELGCDYLTLFNNGTTALLGAMDVLDIQGEVITTPYSFVATSHAILWKNCEPKFVDISSMDLNIDPLKVREAITDKTVAILAVHCYGYPCDVEELERIGKEFNIKIIYDAAHAFGVHYKNKSILSYGDASTLSFHATKVFSTIEGGAVVFKKEEYDAKAKKIINFGFESEGVVTEVGLNFKLNEIQAVMGILQLKNLKEILRKRKSIADKYVENFSSIDDLHCLKPRPGSTENYSYFPLLVRSSCSFDRDKLYSFLKNEGVYARKYFHPLITDFKAYRKYACNSTPIAKDAAARVLCLPIYPDLSNEEQNIVIARVREFFQK